MLRLYNFITMLTFRASLLVHPIPLFAYLIDWIGLVWIIQEEVLAVDKEGRSEVKSEEREEMSILREVGNEGGDEGGGGASNGDV